MKWGVLSATSGVFIDPDLAETMVTAAEEAGFESIWGGEHVAVPVDYRSTYPFSDDGKLKELGRSEAAKQDQEPYADPVTWFAYAAGMTRRIKFGSGVTVVPQHEPLLFAKQCATLDRLSNGRLIIGTGIGWLKEEFEAQAIPWERRAARTEEYIAVWRAFWGEGTPEFHGEFIDFPPIHATPKPVTPGGPPVHIGGHGLPGARRAGRIGDGYFPTIYPNSRVKELLPELVAEMRRSATEAGRDPDAIEITSGGARTVEATKWYADLGVHRLLIKARSIEPGKLRDELLRFGDEVIAATGDC